MIEINLFWILVLIVLVVIVFVILLGFKNLLDNKKDIHFKNQDTSITSNLIAKFPLVSPDFINKSAKEQNVENNQEIHELNKKIEDVESRINAQNININKLVIMLEELSKRG